MRAKQYVRLERVFSAHTFNLIRTNSIKCCRHSEHHSIQIIHRYGLLVQPIELPKSANNPYQTRKNTGRMGDADVTASNWRMVEVGRVAIFAKGPLTGRLAVIVQIIDHKRVRLSESWNMELHDSFRT